MTPPSRGPTCEIVFFPIKQDANPSEILSKAIPTWQSHEGFLSAYFGPLVEDPKIGCLVLTWSSHAALLSWTRNYNADEIDAMKAQLGDPYAGLDPFATFVDFKHDPGDAFAANVTEFGFFALPDEKATEEVVMGRLIGEDDVREHPVMTVGGARGAALGWIWAVKPEMAGEGMTTAWMGVFGYASVDDHWRWRETPEHAALMENMGETLKELKVQPVDVLGKRRAMFEGSGMVHVSFQKVI